MPRHRRYVVAGVPVHIIQRGNNRSACFFDEKDNLLYLRHLRELASQFACSVHAYCLMTNHVHLLITPQTVEGCGLLMKNLGQRYVQHVNRSYQRSGTLWEGRFRSCLAQSERYVLACYRYIELNPVRAGMARHPRQYRWSSYRANAEGKGPSWLLAHQQYLDLGRTDPARRDAYRALFRHSLEPAVIDEIRLSTNGGFALGSSKFQAEIAQMLGQRVTRGTPGRPAKQRGSSAELERR